MSRVKKGCYGHNGKWVAAERRNEDRQEMKNVGWVSQPNLRIEFVNSAAKSIKSGR